MIMSYRKLAHFVFWPLIGATCFVESLRAQSVSSGNPEGESTAAMAFGMPSAPPSPPTLTAQRVITAADNTRVNLVVGGLDSGTTALVFRKAPDEPWRKITFSGSTGQDIAPPGKVYTYVAMAKRTTSLTESITYSRPSTLAIVSERPVSLFGTTYCWDAFWDPESVPGPPGGTLTLQQAASPPLPAINLSFAGPFDQQDFNYVEDAGLYMMQYSAERQDKTDLLRMGAEASFEAGMTWDYDGGPLGTYWGGWWSEARISGTGMLYRFDSLEGGDFGIACQASGHLVIPTAEFRPGSLTIEGSGFDSATSPPSAMIPEDGMIGVKISKKPVDLSAYGAELAFETTGPITQIEWSDPSEFVFSSDGPLGPAAILAKIAGSTVATLNAVVKRERVITVQLVGVWGVDGKGRAYTVPKAGGGTEFPIGDYPNAQQLEDYLNNIYGPQANLRFEVIAKPGRVRLMYENEDGLLQLGVFLTGWEGPFNTWNAANRPAGETALNIFYVYGFKEVVWGPIGLAKIGGNWAVLDSRVDTFRDTAHEIGHCLGFAIPSRMIHVTLLSLRRSRTLSKRG